MSWQVSVTQVRRQDAEEKLDEAAEAYWHTLHDNAKEEAKEQFQVAKDCAVTLLDVTQNGEPDNSVNIVLSGHANVNHGLQEGYAREFVQVRVEGAV